MSDPHLMLTSIIAVVHGRFAGPLRTANGWFDALGDDTPSTDHRDCGAVSIEQVLWYAAAAVSVAVVAAIIWGQIRTTASTPVQSPSAP